MIGGLSKASTSILRQLIDAGTLANLPAGFKTRGIRIRDEDSPIQPGEFRDVDALEVHLQMLYSLCLLKNQVKLYCLCYLF